MDILTSIFGVGDFHQSAEKAEKLEVDGLKFRVISWENLITAKEAMGREKDLLVAKELRAIHAERQLGPDRR